MDPAAVASAHAQRAARGYSCCRGAEGSLHAVVRRHPGLEVPAGEGAHRVWLLYRVRAHNYAGWGKWAEMRSPVPFP